MTWLFGQHFQQPRCCCSWCWIMEASSCRCCPPALAARSGVHSFVAAAGHLACGPTLSCTSRRPDSSECFVIGFRRFALDDLLDFGFRWSTANRCWFCNHRLTLVLSCASFQNFERSRLSCWRRSDWDRCSIQQRYLRHFAKTFDWVTRLWSDAKWFS